MAQPGTTQLMESVVKAGFYPELVLDTVTEGLAGADPEHSLVQLETHFDHNEVHRHITVLALAEDALVVAHLDDQQLDEQGNAVVAHVSLETLPLASIASITMGYTYPQPQDYTPGTAATEVTLMISWTGSQRIDIAPADCPDPACEAEHGYTGVAAREDVMMRINAAADGSQAVQDARDFVSALRAAHLKARRP